LIEELEIAREPGPDVRDGLIAVQVHLSDLTERQSRSTNTLSRQQPLPSMLISICRRRSTFEELEAGELAALIGVEDLGTAEAVQRLLDGRDGRDAEVGGERLGHLSPRWSESTNPASRKPGAVHWSTNFGAESVSVNEHVV
jgi:hypothetical protein